MKIFGALSLAAVILGVFGYFNGWWAPEANVSPEVTNRAQVLADDTLESTQKHTNRAFESLKSRIKPND